MSYLCDAIGNLNALQTSTLRESPFSNFCYTIWNFNANKPKTMLKCATSYLSNAIGDFNALQTSTPREYKEANLSNTIWNNNA